jgi:SPP1 family phage portal protein
MDAKELKQIYNAQTSTASQYNVNRAYVRGKNPTIVNNATGDDPDNRLPIPLGKVAVDNMVGYMMPPGEPDIYYQLTEATDEWSVKGDEYNAQIKKWREYNDDNLTIAETVNEAMSQGNAFEVWWTSASDEAGYPVRPEWVLVPASQIYIKWTNSLKPIKEYAVRFYQDGDISHAVVYYPGFAEGWATDKNKNWGRYEEDDLVYPFDTVPVLEAKINKDALPVFEAEKKIMDQLDKVMSKSLNEVDRFNAMIALYPFIIDADTAADLKSKGYFHGLDPVDADKWPRYMEKNLGGAVDFYKWMAENLERYFHKTSRIIDFTDPKFGAGGEESGKALAIKLMCMEMVAAKAEIYLRRWLTERKELFDACINAGTSGIDTSIYKTEIKWSRNVPVSAKEQLEIASMMMGLQMTKEAVLKILPKAILPDWERELEDQKKNTLPAPTVPGIPNADDPDDLEAATKAATLSGIQIKAANDIVAQIYSGALTREAGIQQLMIFLGLTKEQAEAVIGQVEQGGK